MDGPFILLMVLLFGLVGIQQASLKSRIVLAVCCLASLAFAFESRSHTLAHRRAQRLHQLTPSLLNPSGMSSPTTTVPSVFGNSANKTEMQRGPGGRIEEAFAKAKERGEAAFVTFVTAGYPTKQGASNH
jgi:hypothetical protein